MPESHSLNSAVPPYNPISYQIVMGGNKIKGSVASLREVFADAGKKVNDFIYRGTAKSLEENVPEVLGAISMYAVEWLISKNMVPWGPGLKSQDTQVGVWTGSFMKSLTGLAPNSVSFESNGAYISTSIGVGYEKTSLRKEHSGMIEHDYKKQTVGSYGEWLMSKLARYAGYAIASEVKPIYKKAVEDILRKFRKNYKVSQWTSAVEPLYTRAENLRKRNREKIIQAARMRIAAQERREWLRKNKTSDSVITRSGNIMFTR